MPAKALSIIASQADPSHESFQFLQVLLQTLVSPCVGIRFTVVNRDDKLAYGNIYKCAALGYPCSYDAVSDAVAAFRAHPDHQRLIDSCIRQHVYERRLLLEQAGKATGIMEADEIREYTGTAYETLELLAGTHTPIFHTTEDDDMHVMLRLRLLLYRALSLFLLDQLFWRQTPGVTLPNPRRIKTMAHVYLVVSGSFRPSAEGIVIDPDAPASDCLTSDQLYRLKSTEDPFMHDLVNNYDYRTTLLSDDARPADGQDEFSASMMYAEELKELTSARAFDVSTEDSGVDASGMLGSAVAESLGEPLSFGTAELFQARRLLNPATAAALRTLVTLPVRFHGDAAAAFFLTLQAVASDIGLSQVTVSPITTTLGHVSRRRCNLGGIFVVVDPDPRHPKVTSFDDIVDRFLHLCGSIDNGGESRDRLADTTDADLERLMLETGFGPEAEPTDCDGTKRCEDLVVLATMVLNRFDLGAFPTLPTAADEDGPHQRDDPLSSPHRSGHFDDDDDDAPKSSTEKLQLDADAAVRLMQAAPLDLVGLLIDHLCDDTAGGAITRCEEGNGNATVWEGIAVVLRWGSTVMHHERQLKRVNATEVSIDGSDETAAPPSTADSSRIFQALVTRTTEVARRILRVAEERLQPRALDTLQDWVEHADVDVAANGLSIPLAACTVIGIASLSAPLLDGHPGLASSPSFRAQPPPPAASVSLVSGVTSMLRRALVQGPVHRGRFALAGPVDRQFAGEGLLLAWHCDSEQREYAAATGGRDASPDAPAGTDLMSEHSAPYGTSVRFNDEVDGGSPLAAAPPKTEPSSPKPSRAYSATSRASSMSRLHHAAASRARDSNRARDVFLRALASHHVDPYHVALRLMEASATSDMHRRNTFRVARSSFQ